MATEVEKLTDYEGLDKQLRIEIYLSKQKVDLTEENEEYFLLLSLLIGVMKQRRNIHAARAFIRKRTLKTSFFDKLYDTFAFQNKLISKVYRSAPIKLTKDIFKTFEFIDGQSFAQALRAREFGIKRSALRFSKEIQNNIGNKTELQNILNRYVETNKRYNLSGFDTNASNLRNKVWHHIEKDLDITGWVSMAVLDNRTSALCISLNGRFYSKKQYPSRFYIPNLPPRHFNCRSQIVFVERGVSPKDYAESDLNTLFTRNPRLAQDVLGKKKYDLWKKSGVNARKLYDKRDACWFTNNEIADRFDL